MVARFSAQNFNGLCDELARRDADLSSIIDAHGYPPIWMRANTYETLVHIVLEQQVSLASALAALNKLRDITGGITPRTILSLSDEQLRAGYVSRQKIIYLRNLANEIIEERLILANFETATDEEVRRQLTTLKGIGNWTADVYLMFVLQRPDIFPVGDLAAVNALKRIKKLDSGTTTETLLAIAETWKPFRTIATMLLWHQYLSSPFRKLRQPDQPVA